jgi:hypothetical protein
MQFSQWLEATQPYVKKLVDPALLTQDELYRIVNSTDKSHPSSAYRFSVNSETSELYHKNDYPELLQNRIINGIRFEFRINRKDKTENSYVKTDSDGEILRGEDKQPIYYTKQELLKRFANNRYEYSVGVFVGDKYIGGCDDEWRCVLYRVADEYQGFGLGTILAKIAWGLEPGKTSGGFTAAGYRTFQSMHREAVREYLQTGMYSYLIKTGQISKEKVQQIIGSVKGAVPGKILPRKETSDKRLNSDDPRDYLLMDHEGSFILYDKKLKDVINEEEHYWKFQMIKGMVYALEGRIKVFGGETKEIKELMLILAAMDADESLLYVEPEDLPYVNQELMTVSPLSYKAGYKSYPVKLRQKIDNAPIRSMVLKEKQFRKSFDRYDEFKIQVVELAYSKYDN